MPFPISHEKLLGRKKVEQRIDKRKSWIYREIAAGNFPAPVKIGPRSVAWVESEIDAWINQTIKKDRQKDG